MLKYISSDEDQLENSLKLGDLLSKARVKLALSQKEIASRLNLREEIIAALDANDFDKLPAPIYVMGYIRSYARAVNLNSDTLISIYEGVDEKPPEILPDVKPPVQASSRDKPVQAMSYLITFTLVILLIAWWQGQYIVSTDFFSTGAKTSEGGEYPGGFSYTYDIVTHPETFTMLKTDDPENNGLKNMGTTATPDIANSPGAESSGGLDTFLEYSDLLSIEDPSSLIDSEKNSDILKMELSAESWIEIYDVLGKKL
ncbi:MAG: helix-turn-helix domain-containing protein, partial [Gammaproteobacteria bacterium]